MTVNSTRRKPAARSAPEHARPRRAAADFIYRAEDSIGFQMRITLRDIRRLLRQVLATEGLTMGVWFFLRVLWEEDGMTQKEITARVGMMQPTAAKALLALERDGLVELSRDPRDRRKMRIFLTRKGWRLKDTLLPKVALVNNEIALAGFSKAEIAVLWKFLERIRANAEARPAPALLRRLGIRAWDDGEDVDNS